MSFAFIWNMSSGRMYSNGGNLQEIPTRISLAGALCALSIATVANAAVKEEPVTYKAGDTTLKGFVVYDDAKKGKRPGIVMVHEWRGITKHVHNEAHKLAE